MKRTQLICLHEGKSGSVDSVFANRFMKTYDPSWMRPWKTGSIRFVPCGGKTGVLKQFPAELKNCDAMGGDTTLVVLADLDDDCKDGDALKEKYRKEAKAEQIDPDLFSQAVFIFPKDRIENWIQYLNSGKTDENVEAPRVKNSEAVEAAKKLAELCRSGSDSEGFPPSLKWSCTNWRKLTDRMLE